MREPLFDVIAVQIKSPHRARIMARDLNEKSAAAFIKFTILRRGVEDHFYKSVPAGSHDLRPLPSTRVGGEG